MSKQPISSKKLLPITGLCHFQLMKYILLDIGHIAYKETGWIARLVMLDPAYNGRIQTLLGALS